MIHYKIPLHGIKFSTNKSYAGVHWTKRKAIKDSIHDYVFYLCRPIRKVESYPVAIKYRFAFTSRPLDTLNTAIMAKMFEDAFRSIGILEDDDPKFVKSSLLEVVTLPKTQGKKGKTTQGKQDYEENYVEITITPYATTESI